MARPKKFIDLVLAEKLAVLHCTQEEIASVLGLSVDTLQRSKEFMEMYDTALKKGRASLRRLQWKLAEAGDRTMQIWLGKQILGQRDNVGVDYTGGFQVRIGFEDDEH